MKLKYTFLLLLLICLTFTSFSQDPNFVWAKKQGGTLNELGQSIAIDGTGSVYTTGSFQGTSDFDPGVGVSNLTSTGDFVDYDAFISKVDANGNFIWVKSLGSKFNDAGQSISIDDTGNIYVAGYFSDTLVFDPGSGISNIISNGGIDIFLSKLDVNGNFIWVKNLGGMYTDIARSIVIGGDGNIFIAGDFMDTADFDPGTGVSNLTSNGGVDAFILKLDVNGNFVWAKNMGGTSSDIGYSIAIDGAENIYSIGRFEGVADFDPGAGVSNLTSNGGVDIFLSKLDANGNFVWAKNLGGNSTDFGVSIAIDNTGNLYTTGYFKGTVDFNPGVGVSNLASNGDYDVFISKFDVSGNLVWAKSLGGALNDYGEHIAIDGTGNVYITGRFSDAVDFDPGVGLSSLISNGSWDAFILKLDANGNFVWAKNMGGASADVGQSITISGTGNIYALGYFQDEADFGQGAGGNSLTSNGLYDLFTVKLSQCVPNTGLDVSVDGLTISATNSSATSYQWIDCSDNSLIAVETASSFTATENGSYAVIITDNDCSDTTECVVIDNVSIKDIGDTELVQIYPNPAATNITVDFGENTSTSVKLLNNLGQVVSTYEVNNQSQLNISTTDFARGVYFVKIQQGESELVKRIVLTK